MPGTDLASLDEDLALIREAAADAGQIAMAYFDQTHRLDVRYKSGNSPVTEADLAVDRHLAQTLLAARPSYGWLSEETADADPARRMDAKRTFVVDPIDGTRAFVDGKPVWCVSVAIVEGTSSVAGVLECPALDERFEASAGSGALSATGRIGHDQPAAVVTGSGDMVAELSRRCGTPFSRHGYVPSLAYRIAMVADGRLSGTFIKPRSHDWDIAAAALILAESGGMVVTASGQPAQVNRRDTVKPFMVAARNEMIEPMLSVVASGAIG